MIDIKNRITAISLRVGLLFWPPVIILFHVLKTAFFLRAVDWAHPWPIMSVDYALYYGRALRVAAFLETSGRFWGYDPYQMAGYISGPVHEVGNYLMSLLAAWPAKWVPVWATLLAIETAGLFLGAPCIFLAVYIWKRRLDQAWAAFGMTALYYGLFEPFSRFVVPIGLFGYQVAAFAAFVQAALFHEIVMNGGRRPWIAFIALSAVLPQIHPLGIVISIIPMGAIYLSRFRRLAPSFHMALAAAVALTLAANWYWIRPYAAFSEWRVAVPYMAAEGLRAFLRAINPFFRGSTFDTLQGAMNLGALSLAICYFRRRWNERREETVLWSSWAGTMGLLGYFSRNVAWVEGLQPMRFTFPFWLIILCAAGFMLLDWARESTKARLGLMVATIAAMTSVPLYLSGVFYAPWYALTNRMLAVQKPLFDRLVKGPLYPGRLLLETTDGYDPMIADIIPEFSRQPLLGASNPGNPLLPRTTLLSGKFWNGDEITDVPTAFDRNLTLMSEEEFGRMLDLYNVGAVAAYSPGVIEVLGRFDRLLEIEPEPLGRYFVYRKKGVSDWFVAPAPDARIDFDHDRITVHNAPSGRFTIKFHWLRSLKADGAKISPAQMPGLSVPFIEIDNTEGLREIIIRNSGL